MVSNKTVEATAGTSEIAWGIKLDYNLVDFVRQATASRKKTVGLFNWKVGKTACSGQIHLLKSFLIHTSCIL